MEKIAWKTDIYRSSLELETVACRASFKLYTYMMNIIMEKKWLPLDDTMFNLTDHNLMISFARDPIVFSMLIQFNELEESVKTKEYKEISLDNLETKVVIEADKSKSDQLIIAIRNKYIIEYFTVSKQICAVIMKETTTKTEVIAQNFLILEIAPDEDKFKVIFDDKSILVHTEVTVSLSTVRDALRDS